MKNDGPMSTLTYDAVHRCLEFVQVLNGYPVLDVERTGEFRDPVVRGISQGDVAQCCAWWSPPVNKANGVELPSIVTNRMLVGLPMRRSRRSQDPAIIVGAVTVT